MEIRSRTKSKTKIQFHKKIFVPNANTQNARNRYKIELEDAVKYYIQTQSLNLADTFEYS